MFKLNVDQLTEKKKTVYQLSCVFFYIYVDMKHTHLVHYILQQNSAIDPNRYERLQTLVSFDQMSDYLRDCLKNLNPLANHFADAAAVYQDERMV